MKRLPPDANLQSLAKRVNARLRDVDGGVNFYLIEHTDGSHETGMVFQCGVRRAVVYSRATYGDADADDIVRSVNDWINDIRPTSKWTEDPKDAA